MINLKYLIFCFFIPFSSKIFSKEIYWNPAFCSINGYEVIFIHADFFYNINDILTLNGATRMGSPTEYWIDRADNTTSPKIKSQFPYAYNIVWYDTPEKKFYKLNIKDFNDYHISNFNTKFYNNKKYQFTFCLGTKGRVFTYISNGFERKMISQNIAPQFEFNTKEYPLNFLLRSENYFLINKITSEEAITQNIDYINYINQNKKIHLKFKGDINSFVSIENIKREIAVYYIKDIKDIKEQIILNFPKNITIFNSNKQNIDKINMNDIYEKYSNLDNIILTIIIDSINQKINLTIHQNEKLIYSK